ncbi:ROK family transcriptional regulator [Microbacterium deminutum]
MRDTSGLVLDLIRSGGEISRVELAGQSGLTEASISRIVRELLDGGVILETGFGLSTGGKRPTLLKVNNRSRHAVGAFLGESAVHYVLADLGGSVVATLETAGVAHSSLQDLLRRMPAELDKLIRASGVPVDSLVGVGIAAPGRRELGTIPRYDELRDFVDWDWRQIEAELAASTGLAVAVENDSTCAAIGEYWVSGASATEHFLVVNLSIGFGCGLVTGGDVYRGASSNVGEIGHMTIDWDGPQCPCGGHGCLEVLAAPARVVAQALEIDGLQGRLGLSAEKGDHWSDFERIAAAAMNGDAQAVDLVEHSARALATALVSLTNVLDLQRIVLTGPGFDVAGEIYARITREVLEARALIRNAHTFEVRLSASRHGSAALGAATLAIHQQLGGSRRSRALLGT